MRRDYKLFLRDIIDAMKAIENFVEGMTFDDFIKDDKTSSAVIRKFEIIGEATRSIPDEIKKSYPQVPWKYMIGMRDKLIHGYFGIDFEIVWDAIKIDVPKVKPELLKILKELEEKT